MDPTPFEAFFGVKIAHIAAGLAGGTVRALLTRGSWGGAVTSVIVGSLTAAYMTQPVYEIATTYLPIAVTRSSEYATSYVVGVTGMFLAEGLITWARRWAKNPSLPSNP